MIQNNNINVGDIINTNEGCFVKIVDILNKRYCKIEFIDDFKYTRVCQTTNIIKGSIKNPYKKSVYNIGYKGEGLYKISIEGKHTKEYKTWSHMLERCYSYKYHIKFPSYKNVIVCEEWLNFQNFAEWYEVNFPKHIDGVRFELDKDLLQQGLVNKIYSPDTCIFLPQKVNGFITNIQKTNTSGKVGVSFYKPSNKYRTSIHTFKTGKIKHLGYFDTIEEASEEYVINRDIQVSHVKEFLTSLNYLDEYFINLIA